MTKQGERLNPREVFDRAMASPDMTPDDLAAFNSQRAAEMAKAEARRQPPQVQLQLDEAA